MENAFSKADEKLNRLEKVSREDLNQLKMVKKKKNVFKKVLGVPKVK